MLFVPQRYQGIDDLVPRSLNPNDYDNDIVEGLVETFNYSYHEFHQDVLYELFHIIGLPHPDNDHISLDYYNKLHYYYSKLFVVYQLLLLHYPQIYTSNMRVYYEVCECELIAGFLSNHYEQVADFDCTDSFIDESSGPDAKYLLRRIGLLIRRFMQIRVMFYGMVDRIEIDAFIMKSYKTRLSLLGNDIDDLFYLVKKNGNGLESPALGMLSSLHQLYCGITSTKFGY